MDRDNYEVVIERLAKINADNVFWRNLYYEENQNLTSNNKELEKENEELKEKYNKLRKSLQLPFDEVGK